MDKTHSKRTSPLEPPSTTGSIQNDKDEIKTTMADGMAELEQETVDLKDWTEKFDLLVHVTLRIAFHVKLDPQAIVSASRLRDEGFVQFVAKESEVGNINVRNYRYRFIFLFEMVEKLLGAVRKALDD